MGLQGVMAAGWEGWSYRCGSIFGEPKSARVGGSMVLCFLLYSEWVSSLDEEGYRSAMETSRAE